MAYDMCPKCDQLYRCEHDQERGDDGMPRKLTICSTPGCNQQRYKPNTDSKGRKVPFKRYFYVPIGPWLQSLFLNPWFVDQMQYGSEKLRATLEKVANESTYTIDDIHDGELFQKLAEDYPSVVADCLSIFLGIAADGFCPYSKHGGHKCAFKKSKSYSITPITATIYNLPPHMRTRHGAVHIVGIVPGPSYSDIQTFLAPLADELLYYWLVGLDIKYRKPSLNAISPTPPSSSPPSHDTVSETIKEETSVTNNINGECLDYCPPIIGAHL